jgi:hypothetical protein
VPYILITEDLLLKKEIKVFFQCHVYGFLGTLFNVIIFLISLLKAYLTRSPAVNGTTLGQLWLWVSPVCLIYIYGRNRCSPLSVVPVFGTTVNYS